MNQPTDLASAKAAIKHLREVLEEVVMAKAGEKIHFKEQVYGLVVESSLAVDNEYRHAPECHCIFCIAEHALAATEGWGD